MGEMSFERLDTLRERNKDLLLQLRERSERLHSLAAASSGPPTRTNGPSETVLSAVMVPQEHRANVGGCETTVTLNNDRSEETESPLSVSVSVVTLPGAELGQARAALGRPRAQLTAEPPAASKERNREEAASSETDSVCASTPPLQFGSQGSLPVGSPTYSGLLQDKGNSRAAQARKAGSPRPKSILSTHDREQREAGRVTFHDQVQDQHHLRPLLGYDWIAGLLDADSSLTERSEQFFTELRNFRQVNREECIHSQHTGVREDDLSPSELPAEERDPHPPPDTHQCTFCYRINSRLFPAPLDSQTACPVCKMPKSKHPHTASEPAFIRVSIPRSTLLPAHRYKAHRRRSFDPSDSLGLPSHCLSGWSNRAPAAASQVSSLDLRSSLKAAHSAALPSARLTAQAMEQQDPSVSGVTVGQRSEELIDVSRLAQYRSQHIGPDRMKPHSTTHRVY